MVFASESGEVAGARRSADGKFMVLKAVDTLLQVVQQHRRLKKKLPPKLPAPPRKKSASEDSQLT